MPSTILQLLLPALLVAVCQADVLRTVYCQNQCNDYLHVPESQMPACAEEHLKMNMCGTVITCDWREAEKDKVRPVANNTDDFKCCYKTVIKEKGDCDLQLAEAQARESKETQTVPEVQKVPTNSAICVSSIVPWVISAVLAVVVAVETGYLLWFRMSVPISQKVCSADMLPPYQRPLYTARPLIDQSRLLA